MSMFSYFFKMTCKARRLCACLIFMVVSAYTVAAEPIKLTTESYPPFNMITRTGEISGISTDIVHELFKRSQIPVEMELLPWNRAYSMAQESPNVGVFSTTRTVEREKLFKWVSPLTSNNWVFLAKKDRNIRLSSLEDAKKYRIGGYRGDAIALYLEAQGFNLDLVSRDELNALKLDRGRIDLWATGHLLGPYLAKKQRVDGLVDVLTFKETVMGIAFHPETPDTVINRLNTTLQEMYDDGSVDRIFNYYR